MEHEGKYTRIFWSPEMISLMKRHYPSTKNEEMAGIVGVSVRTINRKAKELGLQKDPQWIAEIREENRRMAQAESKRKGYPGVFKNKRKQDISPCLL